MNIDSTTAKTKVQEQTGSTQKSQPQNDSQVKFSDELKELKKTEEKVSTKKEETAVDNSKQNKETKVERNKDREIYTIQKNNQSIKPQNKDIKTAVQDLGKVLKELNQPDENNNKELKYTRLKTDNNNRGENLINNDFSIPENPDKLPQMNFGMNFGGDGQPFSSLMNNAATQKEEKLSVNQKDLAEESEILSSMAENIAMANRLNVESENSIQTVVNNDGIKKVDIKTGETKETIVKFDTVILNEADAEVFANLVQNGEINLDKLAPEAAQKSVQISKTLADLIAKSMTENKPVRIEFDNNISVIIRISRDGKLSADFLPSSQVAEAYLKENLPLLRQKFDDNNLEYEELNQRERQDRNKERQNKRGRNDE